MGNHVKKVKNKLKIRQADFDGMRNTKGYIRPGSQNLHKQHGSNGGKKRYR